MANNILSDLVGVRVEVKARKLGERTNASYEGVVRSIYFIPSVGLYAIVEDSDGDLHEASVISLKVKH